MNNKTLTPKEIVSELDKYVIGQDEAKKAISIAVFNRHRRLLLNRQWQEAITPKNLMMIGPTGVGKTEIARRLAKVVGAPFIKVEATKFTEVGYVGRDVESMVRDLADISANMEAKKRRKNVRDEARRAANKRLIEILVPEKKEKEQVDTNSMINALNNFGNALGLGPAVEEADIPAKKETIDNRTPEQKEADAKKEKQKLIFDRMGISEQLQNGELEDKVITLKVKDNLQSNPSLENMGSIGIDMSETLDRLVPPKYTERKMTVKEAREVLIEEESDKLIDSSDLNEAAVKLTENSGIIFIDEFDKIASSNSRNSGEVSREGVQRDILPIVEGSQVKTKYGMVDTDHILFIASGAFQESKPSDLIAELQGRFPIRVELKNLSEEDFRRILTEPDDAIIKQYVELIKTDGVDLSFSSEAIDKIAEISAKLNETNENIGARRLATVIEKLLEDILFETPGMQTGKIEITDKYVEDKLTGIISNRDLSEYIL
ncbi:ATP-dependent protease ATPase subunit HslU [Xylocopilactobacillus apis]|uniref:ATP-dependent protease ATPase subunit HslU n=1 Tax=Xylocopilactobacillus apis TaxID=2932183 RepID=A0AAU9DA40_9LACO|nr:ATP-dependent protease ATPase subunit HslU [Xylocopilactobacillus apis]BDR56520.1 ATP-dependent protease ATPase subunit HslU [Xylocopilactobacillus apis]